MKILLVDDHALFRAGLRMLLTTICHDATTLEAATIADGVALAQQHPGSGVMPAGPVIEE
jgi:DNA-binding NarL/FixJ family response regulator